MKKLSCPAIFAFLMCFLPSINVAKAQNVNSAGSETSTAILDTSIPFAIGAREGEQTIRSSFGWPTFQEGFVEGVYFRFDPDGYARFSVSPRLDEDVFEVICQSGSTLCLAKKDGLEISITADGKPQISIVGITPLDRFFISDRKSELPLPNAIIGPVDQRLETLLSTGGDLVIRRELETVQKLSLSGFLATVTYLRWVLQNQASFVFPRSWPIPSQSSEGRSPSLLTSNGQNSIQTELSRNPAVGTNQNLQSWTDNKTQINTNSTSPAFVNNTDISANGFAQQARGRNLPADINRFEILPSRNTYAHQNSQSLRADVSRATVNIESELIRLNQALHNIEIKIDNMAARISHEIQSSNFDVRQGNENVSIRYPSIVGSVSDTGVTLNGADALLSQEEKLRQSVIENIINQAAQAPIANAGIPNPATGGEVSVKKNIVERLIEELNGTQKEEVLPPQSAPKTKDDFVSLSDYVNKILQAEKQK